MKKWILTGIVCLGVAGMLCGCSKSSSSTTETTAESSAEATSETSETDSSTAKELNDNVYAYDYDVEKMVTLGDYKGLTYTKEDTTVTDEEVQSDIDSTLAQYAEAEQITDREVADGDTVNIDFTGTMDGEEFDGGSSAGYSLTIGSGSFIDGFEDGLIGKKPGEEVTLDLTFPEDYSDEDKAGKAVQFAVTINYIEGDSVTPELTDDFVKNTLQITGVETVDQYKEYVKNELESENEQTAEQNKQEELVTKAVENATINEYPEELVNQYKDTYVSYYEQYASYYGMDLADFISQYGAYLGTSATTEEELEAEGEDYGKEATANMLVICAIAKAEDFEVTEDIYQEKLKEFVEEYSFDSTDALESQYGERYLKQIMINEEVFSILEKDAVGVEETEVETSAE